MTTEGTESTSDGPSRPAIRALVTVARGMRDAWLILGVTFAVTVFLEFAYRGQAALRGAVRQVDTTAPHPYADSVWFADYSREYAEATDLDWRPFVYYRRAPYTGAYVNVDEEGRRRTVQDANAGAPHTVFLFGGSTMWGDYQRGAATLPSVVARELATRGIEAHLTNFGESGYVMTQGVIELIVQLRSGARPDVVVFYDGINDVAAAVQSGTAGVPQNEFNRSSEFELGRAVRGWETEQGLGADVRAFSRLTLTGAERSQLLARLREAIPVTAAAAALDVASISTGVAETYAATVRLVEALAREYHFRAVYVWQPNPHLTGKVRTPYEATVLSPLDSEPFHQNIGDVHRAVVPMLAQSLGDQPFVDLTGLFDEVTAPVWVDAIGHTTEGAADEIGTALADLVASLLSGEG